MTKNLNQLIYLSCARHEMDQQELMQLLDVCRENNRKSGITGILLYARGTFLQVLEGEKTRLDDLYKVISRDPRHKDLIMIEEEAIDERMFGQWSMAFKHLKRELEDIPGLSAFFQRGIERTELLAHREEIAHILEQFKSMS